jgi:DNA-binding response OmpR family regulator
MSSPDNRTMSWTYVLDEPLRILVVDDDPILREFASVYLATPSATIETACDGIAARTQLGQVDYDLLLLDIEMPDVNGLSLLEEIRSDERLKRLPVIMLTGHDDIASIDRAYGLGANSFATKPVNWRQLSYQIRSVIRMTRPEGLQIGAQAPLQGLESRPTPATTERDVREFYQSVIHRADAIEQRLSVTDRDRFSEQLATIRYVAELTLAKYSKGTRCSTSDNAHSPSAAHQLSAGKIDRTITDRKSVNAIELQS